jgi:integrase/recombinase XerD
MPELEELKQLHLEHLKVRHYSQRTQQNRSHYLNRFIEWCAERSLDEASEVSLQVLEAYQRHLFYYRKTNGKPMSAASQNGALTHLRSFFRWCCRQRLLGSNPASELELPRLGQRLPREVLTSEEAEAVLGSIDPDFEYALRDRAILEVFYSTGIRRQELIDLKIYDLDVSRELLHVRKGKGNKARYIPIGQRALIWTLRYLEELRPQLVMPPDEQYLFLSKRGTAFNSGAMGNLVKGYIDRAEIGKKGGCHLFRHTCATLMLENGADVRFIQQMLGHAELSTTQVYTRVAIGKLKEIHSATHPARMPE